MSLGLHSRPLVSVVIPAHNARGFVARAVRSALAQDWPVEVVVVDDGSDDCTHLEAAGLGGEVRCVRQEHQGAAAARNAGIALARGRYVAFLDADDEWLDGHLKRAMATLERNPQLKWCGAQYEDRDASTGHPMPRPAARADKLLGGRDWFDDFLAAAAAGAAFSTITMVIDRDVLLEAGGFFRELRWGEDLDLWFRIALRHGPIGYGAAPSAIYWHRRQSLTGSGTPLPAQTMLERIHRDMLLAQRAGPEAMRRARPLIRLWLLKALRLALAGGERPAMDRIVRDFARELPWRWKAACGVCGAVPGRRWRIVGRAASLGGGF